MQQPQKGHNSQPDSEETIPFDDCLRVLVNTPPRPKRADKTTKPENAPQKPQKRGKKA